MTEKRGRAVAAAAAVMLGVSTGCVPPPDLDGELVGAIPLNLGVWHRDSLDCEGLGDCQDWFRVAVPGEGTVQVDAARGAEAVAETSPPFRVRIADVSGRAIGSGDNAGGDRVRVTAAIDSGPVHVAIGLPDPTSGVLPYELRVSFRPKPIPEPSFDTVRSMVLEVERRPEGGQAVLIDKGRKAGIARGNKGKLVESGRKIAEIEVLDVYDDGSRALIRGSLAAPITPQTVVEVQVPR